MPNMQSYCYGSDNYVPKAKKCTAIGLITTSTSTTSKTQTPHELNPYKYKYEDSNVNATRNGNNTGCKDTVAVSLAHSSGVRGPGRGSGVLL